jgi:hypothetical protein
MSEQMQSESTQVPDGTGAQEPPQDGGREMDHEGCRPAELFEGDRGDLSLPLRSLLVTILKGPYLFRERRRDAWEMLLNNRELIEQRLNNLLLCLVLDEEVGVAFVRAAEIAGEQLPSLLNRYSFKFLDSVLIVEMRDRLMRAQQSGSRAMMSLDEIRTLLSVVELSARADTALFATRVNAVVKRMRERHLLLPLDRTGENWEVSPVLKVVFDASLVEQLSEAYEGVKARRLEAAELAGGAPSEDEAEE